MLQLAQSLLHTVATKLSSLRHTNFPEVELNSEIWIRCSEAPGPMDVDEPLCWGPA